MRTTPLTQIIHDSTDVDLDRGAKIVVNKPLHIRNDRDIFAIGDIAHMSTLMDVRSRESRR